MECRWVEQFRLDKSRDRYGVGCVKAHLLGEIVRRAGRQHGRHQPPLAAGFFETMQDVGKNGLTAKLLCWRCSRNVTRRIRVRSWAAS